MRTIDLGRLDVVVRGFQVHALAVAFSDGRQQLRTHSPCAAFLLDVLVTRDVAADQAGELRAAALLWRVGWTFFAGGDLEAHLLALNDGPQPGRP